MDWMTELIGKAAPRVRPRGGSQRLGQAYFNAADETWPGLLDQIVGTDADPFYDDYNLPAFFAYLTENVNA